MKSMISTRPKIYVSLWGVDKHSRWMVNVLIRELNDCSLGGDFQVMRHAEICQFDCISLEIKFILTTLITLKGTSQFYSV